MVEINQNEQLPSVPAKRPPFWAFLLVSFFLGFLTFWTFVEIGVNIQLLVGSLSEFGVSEVMGLTLILSLPLFLTPSAFGAAIYGVLVFKTHRWANFWVLVSFLLFVFSANFIYTLNSLVCNNIWCTISYSLYIPVYSTIFLVPAITFAWVSRRYVAARSNVFFLLCLKRGVVVFVTVALISTLFQFLAITQGCRSDPSSCFSSTTFTQFKMRCGSRQLLLDRLRKEPACI